MLNWLRSSNKSSETTTNSSSSAIIMSDSNITPQEQDSTDRINAFIAEQPQSMYLIDGKKGTERSIICRRNESGGQTCLNLDISSITLFKKMQSKNYFCSLPLTVTDTHFECRKIQ